MGSLGYSPAGVRKAALPALVLLGVATTAPALGAGEEEWQVGLRAGPGTVSFDQRKPWGLATALDLDYGLSDAWAVSTTLAASFHSVDSEMIDAATARPGGTVRTLAALAGLTYTFDVLRLIPYANVELGVVRFAGAVVQSRTLFAAELGVGADYFVSRRWTTGISFQYLFAPEDLISDPLNLGSSPFSFSATWRVSRIF
jgi:hypothetical protein